MLEKFSFNKFFVLKFLGKISYEIYVVHGFFLILYKTGIVIKGTVLYIAAVIISTVICAVVVHPAVKYVYSSCRKRIVRG